MTAEALMAISMLCDKGSVMKEGQMEKVRCQKEMIVCMTERPKQDDWFEFSEGERLARCYMRRK
jgi:hypothetical protein